MIKIKDKKDSIYKMKELGLNYFPQDVFEVQDLTGIKMFFDTFQVDEYVLRSPDRAMGNFYYVKSYDEAVPLLKNFNDLVTISISYRQYKDDLIIVGDIKIHRGFDGNDTVDLTARTDKEATQRNIYENPQYNLHCSLEDNKVWNIPGFSKIVRYITEHELYDVIVEFSVYDGRYGVNKENVVITELRTSY